MWAMDVTRDLVALTVKDGGYDELIRITKRGKQDKPDDYANGVQAWINKLMDARDVAAMRGKS
jgi:hypothetical protein